MSKTMKNIPKVRFPEFKHDGAWDEKFLNDIATKVNIKNRKLEVDLVLTNSAVDGIVSQRDYFERDIANKDNLSGYYIVEINDFIYNPRISSNAPVGSLKRNNLAQGIMSPLYMVFRFKNGKLSFFEHYFETSYWYSYMRGIANTGAKFDRLNISNEQFFNLPMPFPRLKEQQKIAECLSSLDALILAQSSKVEALKAHKKALMQQLFPIDGETTPRLRFPEFQNAPEWEKNNFSNYIKLYRGSSPRPIQEYLTKDASGVNWIKIGDTKNAVNSIINKVEEKITQEGAEKSRKVNVGELILANSMSFGKTYELEIEGCIYDGWFVLREYEEYFYKPFLLQLLNSEYMQQQYQKLSAGGIVQNISSDIVYETILFYTSIKEQQKIADCLSSLDALISAQSSKVEALKQHKKALMQQLFPQSEDK